jgi:anti-sigma B factor antagonist
VVYRLVIEALELQGATILFLAGDLDASASVELREIVAAIIEDGRLFLVLDISGVERMYAAGMSALLELQRIAEQRGGRLVCCGGRPFVRELLRITMIDRALDLQTDLDSALDLASTVS